MKCIFNHSKFNFPTKSGSALAVAFVALALPVSGLQAQGTQIEEIVVQGTATGTGIRGVAPTGSQVLNFTREDLLEQPVREATEIISSLPQGSELDANEITGPRRNSGINLRGLGGNASLVLFDGHRLTGQGVTTIAPDPNSIPFAALQTVEVVMDGASAVYGSDAVAGVVNYIMRDNFEGADISVSANNSDLYDSHKVEGIFGINLDNANVMFGFSAENRDAVIAGDRAYLRDDLTRYGGNDGRWNGGTSIQPGSPGVLQAAGSYYSIPSSYTGVAAGTTGFTIPNAAEVLPTLMSATGDFDTYNLVDSSDLSTYVPQRDRRSAFFRTSIDYNENVEVTYTGMYSERDSQDILWSPLTLVIDETSPLYIAGLGAGDHRVYYNSTLNGKPRTQNTYDKTTNQYVDVRVDLGEWQLNSSLFWGDTRGCGVCGEENNNQVRDNFSTMNPEYLNPYISGYQTGIENFVGQTYQNTDQGQTGANLRLEGPIAELPGGTMRISGGVEYIDSFHYLLLAQNIREYDGSLSIVRDTTNSREVESAFIEAYVPLFGDSNAVPGIQRLDLSLAIRRDDYSDFGSTTNPKFGLTWDVNDDLSLRATYGTAFRAPTLAESNPGSFNLTTRSNLTNNAPTESGIPITNAGNGTSSFLTRLGNTPGLQPEEADMWSLGFDYSPQQIEGLDISVTYYDVTYENRISGLPSWQGALSSAENYNLYQSYITPISQPATCVAGDFDTYDPFLAIYVQGLPGFNELGNPSGDCGVVGYIDRGNQNVGSVWQSGFDIQASYSFSNDLGDWKISTNIAEINKLERSLIPGGPVADVLDKIGFQVGTRGNLKLSWLRNNWNAALTAQFIGEYLNDTTPTVGGTALPDQTVDSWTTFDATVSYTTTDDGSMLSGIRAALGIRNLTDKEPPIVLNGGSAIDAGVHNAWGRIVTLELTKSF